MEHLLIESIVHCSIKDRQRKSLGGTGDFLLLLFLLYWEILYN